MWSLCIFCKCAVCSFAVRNQEHECADPVPRQHYVDGWMTKQSVQMVALDVALEALVPLQLALMLVVELLLRVEAYLLDHKN